jgi:hypothetical protein
MSVKILASIFVLTFVSSFEMMSVRRHLEKDGLHRTLVTESTYVIEKESEFKNCSLVFREKVTNETYVYQEELAALKGFTFFPTWPMDIEKPASVSEERPLIWILPLNQSYTTNDYIKEVEFLKVSDDHKKLETIDRPEKIKYPLLIRNRVKFDYHLRYQPV